MPKELWMEVCNIVQEAVTKSIPKKKRFKTAEWLSEKTFTNINRGIKQAKGKGERKRHTELNEEFQRRARRDKKAFSVEQCKEIDRGKQQNRENQRLLQENQRYQREISCEDEQDKTHTDTEEIKKRQQE